MGTLERIKKYIDNKGLSIRAFEASVGFSNGAFASQLKNNRTIGVDRLENILRVYEDLNVEWLLTGRGDMLRNNIAVEGAEVEYKVIHDPKYTEAVRDQQVVYLYDIEATAGLRAIMDNKNQNIIDTIRIPNLPKCDGAIHVVGDSMYPILKSGDIVLYKEVTDLANIFWGEMYLLSIAVDDEEYITVKYLQRSDEGKDYVRLVSHNQHHSPKDIPTSSITALALVKASIRLNTIR